MERAKSVVGWIALGRRRKAGRDRGGGIEAGVRLLQDQREPDEHRRDHEQRHCQGELTCQQRTAQAAESATPGRRTCLVVQNVAGVSPSAVYRGRKSEQQRCAGRKEECERERRTIDAEAHPTWNVRWERASREAHLAERQNQRCRGTRQ